MKSEGKVAQKYKQAKYRTRSKLMEKRLKRRPCNCIHKGEVSTSEDPNRVVVCRYTQVSDVPWDVTVCSLAVARDCSAFVAKEVPEEIKENFETLVGYSEETQDLGAMASLYPDLAALLWALDLNTPTPELTDPDPPPVEPEPENPIEEEEEEEEEEEAVRYTRPLLVASVVLFAFAAFLLLFFV